MGDGAKIDKQAASNALASWDESATHLDGTFKSQAKSTEAALNGGNWIGNDDAGAAFKKQFDVTAINNFLKPTTFKPKAKQQDPGGGAITGGVVYLGTSAKNAIENSLGADEQQKQQMDRAKKKAAAATSNGSSPASTSAGTSPTAGTQHASALSAGVANASGTIASAQAEQATASGTIPFNGPLQWGVEGSDGKWHALQANTNLNSKEFQGPLHWGIESPDGKWHPLPAHADPKEFQGPMQWGIESPDGKWHALPPNADLSSTQFQGPLQWGVQGADGKWHALPDDHGTLHVDSMPAMFTSEVVGQNGHLTGGPTTGQWHGEAAETAQLNNAHPTDPATTHAAVTSASTAPAQPTLGSEQGFEAARHGAAVTSGQAAPAQPTPIEHHEDVDYRPQD